VTQGEATKGGRRPPLKLAERRRHVAELLLEGMPQEKMADRLDVSRSTITRDVAAIRERWTAEAFGIIDRAFVEDMRRLDAMLGALWPSASCGQLGAVHATLAVLKRRAAMVGYEWQGERRLGDLTKEEALELVGRIFEDRAA